MQVELREALTALFKENNNDYALPHPSAWTMLVRFQQLESELYVEEYIFGCT